MRLVDRNLAKRLTAEEVMTRWTALSSVPPVITRWQKGVALKAESRLPLDDSTQARATVRRQLLGALKIAPAFPVSRHPWRKCSAPQPPRRSTWVRSQRSLVFSRNVAACPIYYQTNGSNSLRDSRRIDERLGSRPRSAIDRNSRALAFDQSADTWSLGTAM